METDDKIYCLWGQSFRMLNVEKKIFLPTYHFSEDEQYVGTLKASYLRARAIFVTQEGNYSFSRDKWLEGRFSCSLNSKQEAIAGKSSGMGYTYWVAHQGIKYFLKPGELFNDKFELHFELFENDIYIGSIKENPSKYLLSVDIKKEIPIVIKCFMFWLSYRSWSNYRSWNTVRRGFRA